MSRTFLTEIIIAIVLVITLLAFISGPQLTMPMNTASMLVVILTITFTAFSAIIWREKARDERERLHRLQAGRISYLAGTTFLTLAVIVQSFTYEIDPWLIGALIVMVLTKILARIYSRARQ